MAGENFYNRFVALRKRRFGDDGSARALDIAMVKQLGRGLPVDTQNSWSDGRMPNSTTLRNIALVLNCSTDYLLGLSDDLGEMTATELADRLREIAAREEGPDIASQNG